MILQCTHRRDLLRQVSVLRQCHLPLLQRAREINILDLFAEIDLLLQQSDQTPTDLQEHRSAFFDGIKQSAARINRELLATM